MTVVDGQAPLPRPASNTESASAETRSLLDATPARRSDLRIGPTLRRGSALVNVVAVPGSDGVHELGDKELFVLTRLDGATPLAQVRAEYARTFARLPSEHSLGRLLGMFAGRGMLRDGGPDPVNPVAPPPVEYRGPFALAPRLIGRVVDGGSVLFSRPMLVLSAVALGFTAWATATRLPRTRAAFAHLAHSPVLIAATVIAFVFGLAVHEMGHALACRRYGGVLVAIGGGLRRGLPYLYCETSKIATIRPRRHRMGIAAAGSWLDALTLAPIALAMVLMPESGIGADGLLVIVLLGWLRVTQVLLPFPGSDGASVFEAAGNLIDLPGHSVAAVLRRSRKDSSRSIPWSIRTIYIGYLVLISSLAMCMLVLGVWLLAKIMPWPLALGLSSLSVPLAAGLRPSAPSTSRKARSASASADAMRPAQDAHLRSAHQSEEVPTMSTQPQATSSTAHSTSQPAIVVENVSKVYGRTAAVDQVSLTVQPGEFFGLIGPNGAGKTTLIELIEGLRKPTSGRIAILGMHPWPRNLELLPRLGVQTQSAAFFDELTAREHIVTVGALYGVPNSVAVAKLDVVGLSECANFRVAKLSGGQRQRLAIASALTHDPDVLFLDEPTASLDPQARRNLWGVLETLKSEGTTIVYTTHHMDEAEALCDRVGIIDHGRILAVDSPSNLIRRTGVLPKLVMPLEKMSASSAATLAAVESVRVDGDKLVLETSEPGRTLAAIDVSVGLMDVATRTSSLEDLYLQLTGTAYRP